MVKQNSKVIQQNAEYYTKASPSVMCFLPHKTIWTRSQKINGDFQKTQPSKIKQVLICGWQLNYDKHFNQVV